SVLRRNEKGSGFHSVHHQTGQDFWVKISRLLGHNAAFVCDVAHLVEPSRIEKKRDLSSSFAHRIDRGIAFTDVADVALFLHGIFCDTETPLENEAMQDDHIQGPLCLREVGHQGGEINRWLEPKVGNSVRHTDTDGHTTLRFTIEK